ncbi:polysaccharide lyase family protein [Spirillospora sp. NPDC048911]|uniref:polysaccharide lyase family protein n=1 Tax=Spirillospora sp. NPDC048911 TaxID=3364527 RepID=UPI0037166F32
MTEENMTGSTGTPGGAEMTGSAGKDRPLARRTALGLAATAAAAAPLAVLPAEASASAGPRPVRRLRAKSEIGRIRLSWEGEAYKPLVDHYAIYGSKTAGFKVGPDTLVAKTVYASFAHDRMGGGRQDWYYRIVVVDAAGNRSRPSAEVAGHSTESVAVSGKALATVGAFDHKSLELALSPNKSSQYRTKFPNGVDYTFGTSRPENDWSYIQPGPSDSWGGSKPSRATFRFALEAVPAGETWLSIWLLDTHASLAGTIALALNGTQISEVKLENGATRGSLEGDATVPGTTLKPSYVELALPASALKTGENVLTIDKTLGSWHVYDALGIFTR